jgi:hypothetical protein
MKIPTLEQIIQNQRLQYSNELKKYYPEFFDFLFTEYITKFEISQSEALYWYFNNLSEHPTCKICGSKVQYKTFANGYRDFCCRSCLSKSNSLKILDKYGTACTLTLPEVKHKTIKTLEEHYGKGVKHNWSSKEVQNKCKQTCVDLYGEDYEIKSRQKAKQTCFERYGDENYRNIDKAKHTFLEKYGVTHFSKIFSDDKKHCIQIKRQNTLRKNKTFSVSKIEEKFANYLTTNKILFKRQYKSSIYPFNCDFYLPDKDLYIEINAHWTHGAHPFDNTNKEDLIKLEQWRKQNTDFYNHAIKTWTKRDVLKREIAKKNNLNYLEMFTNKIDDAIIMFESKIKNI